MAAVTRFISAILGSGDWEVVVRGLEPALGWRIGLGLTGAAAYASAVWMSATELGLLVENVLMSSVEIPGLVFLAYVAGSSLLVAASAFNPIGPSLILLSGVSSGFAAMAGLTVIPSWLSIEWRDATGEPARFLSAPDGSSQVVLLRLCSLPSWDAV